MAIWMLVAAGSPAQLGGGNRDLSRLEVFAGYEEVRAGDRLPVAVRLIVSEGWYTYAEEPGDSGMPPSIRVSGPEGIETSSWRFPSAQAFTDSMGTSYGYKNEVVLLGEVLIPHSLDEGSRFDLVFSVNWMICRDVCVLMRDTATLSLRVSGRTGELGPGWAKLLTGGGWAVPGEAGDSSPGREQR